MTDTGVVRLRRLALAVTLLATACVAPRERPQLDRIAPAAAVRVQVDGAIRSVALEDYVRVAILSEFHPGPGDAALVQRMLELQAIVSRTYALRPRHGSQQFDFCSTTHCQLFQPARARTSRWASAAATAVRRTRGTILRFGDTAATAVFHADCGGHTSAAADVWKGDALPYLRAVRDDGPARAAHAEWRFSPVTNELLEALNADPRTRVGARLDRIVIGERDPAGRVQLVSLAGEQTRIVPGEDLRSVLTRAFGARAFRSTRFDVRPQQGRFEFVGRGFGHGVGLCQAGAFARLRAGASVAQVLSHYFPGTTLQ